MSFNAGLRRTTNFNIEGFCGLRGGELVGEGDKSMEERFEGQYGLGKPLSCKFGGLGEEFWDHAALALASGFPI